MVGLECIQLSNGLGKTMKTYICKKCGYSSIKQNVRSHLREEHRIRGKLKIDGRIEPSEITKNTIIQWKLNINQEDVIYVKKNLHLNEPIAGSVSSVG